MIEEILAYASRFYTPEEYPALRDQMDNWSRTAPFSGLSVLDATPVFANTLLKYLPLLCGGARLSVGIGELTPYDPEVLRLLKRWNIPVDSPGNVPEYDVVSDCAGVFSGTASRFGYVELTRSGIYRYRDKNAPVFFADAGRIKFIETSLGTGDGYLRAMKGLGCVFSGKSVLVFGGGKVGRGIAAYARGDGARVSVVELEARKMPLGVGLVDGSDDRAVAAAIGYADFIVSATGIPGALSRHAAAFCRSRALIANMGVEDEFGPEVPAGRVLNDKRPLNFILPEPTRLKYIDPTLALANVGALELVRGRVGNGICEPSAGQEDDILAVVRKNGVINEELKILGDF